MNIDCDLHIDDLVLIKHLKSINSSFLPKIKEVYLEIKDVLNTRIPQIFPQYTLHDTGHSFRVMEYMSKLIADISLLNELEIVLLVYSALLHDVGMALSKEDIELIENDNFPGCNVKFSAMKKLKKNNHKIALQEYIRRIHGELSGKLIRESLQKYFILPKLTMLDFTDELALICESHTKDYDWIKSHLKVNEVRGDYSFNSQYIAIILRLADILDIDSNRTPYRLFQLISPEGISENEWKQHFVISNNEKIKVNEQTKQKTIVFHGKVSDASIHRKLLVYISWIEKEIISATSLVNGMPSQYNLIYDTKPAINIQTEGYSFSDYKMTLEFKAICSLLMGEKIYGNNELGLRELIQNSIDACRIRKEAENSNLEFGEDIFVPKIKVILDPQKGKVLIKDNGIGMSHDIIKRHFLNIGVSYYNSTDFLLRDFAYKPIGNFGIGFLSCFMLSKKVTVITRHYKSKEKFTIELEKGNEWTSLTVSENVNFEGTEVILDYPDFIKVFNNKPENVERFLNQFFLTDGIDFELVNKEKEKISKVSNLIFPSEPLDKGLIKINLQDYLEGIEGYALIKRRKSFVKKFEDIEFPENLYSYHEENGITKISDFSNFQIDDYLAGQEISYLTIPIVEPHLEEDFNNGMKFMEDDIDEVIERFDRELTWASFVVPKEEQHYLEEQVVEQNDWILDGVQFDELEELGHSISCKTKTFIKKITLFEGLRNMLYLPFDEKDRELRQWISRNEKRKELFLRGVLIKDFRFDVSNSASIFETKSLVANITSMDFIPDISRNNLEVNLKKQINYIIGKAIHKAACKILPLETIEEQTLNRFINSFYCMETKYEKKN